AELHRHVDGAAAVGCLADDQEVRLALEDVAHADPEQRVVVDEKDPRLLARAATVGATPTPFRAAVIHAHLLSSRKGIANQTTVPPSGRERTSKRAPKSSARSRMNCRPNLRRPPAATAPTSKPRPSSRISRTHAPPSSRLLTVTFVAAACLRTF